jgi:hypothetical protein
MKHIFLAVILFTSPKVFAQSSDQQVKLEQKQLLENVAPDKKLNPQVPVSKEKAAARKIIKDQLAKNKSTEPEKNLALIKKLLGEKHFALVTTGEIPGIHEDSGKVNHGHSVKVSVYCVARDGKLPSVIPNVEHPDCIHVDERDDPTSVDVR